MGIKIDITPKDLKSLQALLHQYLPYTLVWAFGSRVKFTAKPTSDLDLVAFISQDQELKFSLLKEALEESSIPFRIDLHNWNELPETFHKNIEADYVEIQSNAKPEMPSEWKTYKLGDVANKIGSGATPRGGKEAYLEKGEYSLIRSQNVLDFSFSKSGLAFISEEQANGLKNVELEENDILLNITGDSVARVCQVPKDILPARVNQHVAIIRGKSEIIDQQFLKYYLLQPSFKQYMLGLASAGATRNALTKSMIESFKILAPSLPSQRQIAQILSSLDDKIELNLQMNQTLEAMAQAIFKEWFVNFNFPGFDGVFENGLPKGWRWVSIGDLFGLTVGGDWGQEEYTAEFCKNVFIVRGTDFDKILSGNKSSIPYRFIKKSNFDKRRITGGDILLEISGGSKEQPTGRTILITDELLSMFDNPVVPASFCRLIRPKDSSYSLFLDNFFNYFYQIGGTWEYQNQSTGISNFQFKFFSENKKIALPKDECLINKFSKIIQPFKKRIDENILQIQTLTQTRDVLLPRLMSGKLKVKNEK